MSKRIDNTEINLESLPKHSRIALEHFKIGSVYEENNKIYRILCREGIHFIVEWLTGRSKGDIHSYSLGSFDPEYDIELKYYDSPMWRKLEGISDR